MVNPLDKKIDFRYINTLIFRYIHRQMESYIYRQSCRFLDRQMDGFDKYKDILIGEWIKLQKDRWLDFQIQIIFANDFL